MRFLSPRALLILLTVGHTLPLYATNGRGNAASSLVYLWFQFELITTSYVWGEFFKGLSFLSNDPS
jgi:hypothetical protein